MFDFSRIKTLYINKLPLHGEQYYKTNHVEHHCKGFVLLCHMIMCLHIILIIGKYFTAQCQCTTVAYIRHIFIFVIITKFIIFTKFTIITQQFSPSLYFSPNNFHPVYNVHHFLTNMTLNPFCVVQTYDY